MNPKEQVFSTDLRESLKVIMQKEIEKLPEILESLDPKERLNVVCKIMPYVFPKVEAVNHRAGEDFPFDRW